MKFSSSDEKKITNAFTKLVQDELRAKGLVDSGKLVKSISTDIVYTSTGISFEVSGEDYFKYLDDKHKITDGVIASSKFNLILDLIEEAMVSVIESNLKF